MYTKTTNKNRYTKIANKQNSYTKTANKQKQVYQDRKQPKTGTPRQQTNKNRYTKTENKQTKITTKRRVHLQHLGLNFFSFKNFLTKAKNNTRQQRELNNNNNKYTHANMYHTTLGTWVFLPFLHVLQEILDTAIPPWSVDR